MSDLVYAKPSKEEFLDVILVSLALSLMFAFTFSIYDASETFLDIFIIFFIFILLLFSTRLFFMKFSAMRNAFEIHFTGSFLDRYGFRKYDRVSDIESKTRKHSVNIFRNVGSKISEKIEDQTYVVNNTIKGIPSYIISLIIYVLTLGIIIYPNMWNYNKRIIPHLHIGTRSEYESDGDIYFNISVSDFRFSKVLIGGFFFYFVISLLMKLILFETTYYWWLVFILYWIAFVTIIPIPGSEGFELFRRNNFGWITIFTILILGMIAVLVFDNFWYMVLITVFSAIAILFMVLWRRLMK